MKFRAQLEDHYNNIIKEQPEIKLTKMASIVYANDSTIELSYMGILKSLGTIKRELSEIITVDDSDPWEVIDNNYVFEVGGDTKSYSVEFIDNLFLFYSRRGYNFTRIKCQQRFGLTPKSWNQIANKFNISKDCDIISPYTKQITPKEELSNIIEDKLDDILSSGEMTTQKYQEALMRKNRKKVEDINLYKSRWQSMVSEAIEKLPNLKEIVVSKSDTSLNNEIVAACGDLHIGGKASDMKITEDWNTEVLIKKLNNMASVINSYNSKSVTISILGDLVETISGLNHINTWQGIEDGMYGSKAIISAYEIIVEHLINRVNNIKCIVGIGGNHDRLQSNNILGNTGAADLIFYMLKERLKGEIEVKYDPVHVNIETEHFNIISVHGDKAIHKLPLADMSLKFTENPKKYLFVASAHLHSFFCKNGDDTEIGRRVTVPSIMTGNKYSDVQVGKSAKSGFVVFKTNIFSEPSMVVENI